MKEWSYASGLGVKLHDGKLEWESFRRSDEWGVEQSITEFLAKGPAVDKASVSKSILREIFSELAVAGTTWLPERGKEPTIELVVLGQTVRFTDDFYLSGHDQLSVKDMIAQMDMTSQEFWRTQKLRCGYLADDTKILQFVFKADTELLLHENGNLFIGTLKGAASIKGAELAAGSNVIFHKDGSLESGTLARPAVIGGVKCSAGQVSFGADGVVTRHS